jgi:hypothetical protein
MLTLDGTQLMSEGNLFFWYSLWGVHYGAVRLILFRIFLYTVYMLLCYIELQTCIDPPGDAAQEDLVPIKYGLEMFLQDHGTFCFF